MPTRAGDFARDSKGLYTLSLYLAHDRHPFIAAQDSGSFAQQRLVRAQAETGLGRHNASEFCPAQQWRRRRRQHEISDEGVEAILPAESGPFRFARGRLDFSVAPRPQVKPENSR